MNEWYCSKFGSRQKCNFIFLFFSLSLSLSLFSITLNLSSLPLSLGLSLSLSLSLSCAGAASVSHWAADLAIIFCSSCCMDFFFGYRGMDRDRLQWVFDDGGFVNTVSLDLVVVFNLSPSHFFSNSVVLGWAWLAMGGGLRCSLWVYVCSLGLGWFWWCFVGGYGWWSRWFWVVVMKEALVIGF